MSDDARWAVGLDPQTISYDDRIVALTLVPRHAAYLVACANAWERHVAANQPAGDRLDAERRGYVVQPEDQMCSYCFHHSIAHTAEGCGLDECQCKRSWSDLRG